MICAGRPTTAGVFDKRRCAIFIIGPTRCALSAFRILASGVVVEDIWMNVCLNQLFTTLFQNTKINIDNVKLHASLNNRYRIDMNIFKGKKKIMQ